MPIAPNQEGDPQYNFIEAREPTELIMCVILAAAYAGLAKYAWEPLQRVNNPRLFFNVEGFFITIALLALVVGLRPYFSPCSLQLSNKGIKYRGPYWPRRKTVNWNQVFRMYISPELVVVLYHPWPGNQGIWPLIIQSVYLADREKIPDALRKYCPIEPVMLSGPSLTARIFLLVGFAGVVLWILFMLLG
ncbi:MAG TPA: hypothetical protein V6D08_07700 [Candidatus Obscuribacterales bacterium]